ncbi:MAG: hypothetical protein CR988_05340 [Treponema sp.]|nr:MAG: hypothetical protein CR988_05340 [Treponema sp.]
MKKCFLFVCVLLVFTGCMSFDFSDDYAKNKADDTAYLQKLFDSKAAKVVIPANPKGCPWITDRLYLKGVKNKTIEFAPGCIIMAKAGAFHDPLDFLITINDCKDLKLIGYGATLQMRKKDYQKAGYLKSQWRHIIALWKSENVAIEGLKLASSGGDGVYIGVKSKVPSKNITLRNLVIEDNHRQGVSVIGVDGFLMEGCSVFGTDGHLPQAGIDFEPNPDCYGFTRCVVRNCSFVFNTGSGIHIFLRNADSTTHPIDIIFENCVSKHNAAAISIMQVKRGVKGKIIIKNCDFKGIQFINTPKSLIVTDK